MRIHPMAWPALRGPIALLAITAVAATPFTSILTTSAIAQEQSAPAPSVFVNEGDLSDYESDDENNTPELNGSQTTGTNETSRPPRDDNAGKFLKNPTSETKITAEPQLEHTTTRAPKAATPNIETSTDTTSPAMVDDTKTSAPDTRSELVAQPVSDAQGTLTLAARTDQTSDIYGQWSAKKLKRGTNLATSKPHPLALDYPSHFVVVCQAGCRKPMQHIVYLEPKNSRGPVFETPKENTATETDFVACVGGCYTNGLNSPLYTVGNTDTSAAGNSWITTSSDATDDTTKKSKKTTGRWYDRLSNDTTPAQ